MSLTIGHGLVAILLLTGMGGVAYGQESPYFVTYDHYLEEPRNLEVAIANTTGLERHGVPTYNAPWLEFEYGVTGWWTTELYLEGVTTHPGGGGFTGARIENRFRPLNTEHVLNPVIYVEYERISEASRIQKEIVGSGAEAFDEGVHQLLGEYANELETKLIVSSAVRGWNVAENMIFEKNLSQNEGVEFGYSVGVSRALGTVARGASCRMCAENFVGGVEAYGGLGSTHVGGLADTRHYVAPVLAWQLGSGSTLKMSAGLGLTHASDRVLLRVGYSHEFSFGGGR